jgi:hypothetical protein
MTELLIGIAVTASIFILTVLFMCSIILCLIENGESNERATKRNSDCK